MLVLYHPKEKVTIIPDSYARWQENTVYQEKLEVRIINVYIPHKNSGPTTIYRRLQNNIVSNGGFRDPIKAILSDLTTRLIELRDQMVIGGGELNVRTHKEAFSKLFLDTMFVDVASHFNNEQPTLKRSPYPLDKVLVSPNYLPKVRGYSVVPFYQFCKSDHAAMVVNLTWTEESQEGNRKERILSSKNQKNVGRFIEIVWKKVEQKKL